MNTVEFLDNKILVPENWDEFTRGQIILIAQELTDVQNLAPFKTKIILNILGMHENIFKVENKVYYVPGPWRFLAINRIRRKKKAYLLDPEEFYFVTALLDFMFEVKPQKNNLPPLAERKVTLSRNHFPKIKIGAKNYYGPSDLMNNITAWEYIQAEIHYERFMTANKEENLNALCSILYRRPKRFYTIKRWLQTTPPDIRLPYNLDASPNPDIWKNTPEWLRLAIYLFFEGVRNYFIKEFPYLYEETEDPLTTEQTNPWPIIIRKIAGHILNIEKVVEVNAYNFLFDLDQQIKENRNKKKAP